MSDDLEELRFDAAVRFIKSAPPGGDSSNATKLKFYALFKQAADGDLSGSRPSMFDPVGRAKWDARQQLRGVSHMEAKRRYVALLQDTNPTFKAPDLEPEPEPEREPEPGPEREREREREPEPEPEPEQARPCGLCAA